MTTIDDLVDDAIFLSVESQARPQLENGLTVHLLGSELPERRVWRWAWAEQLADERSIGLVKRLRDYGAAQGIGELIRPELRLSDGLPLRLTLAVEALTGLSTYVSRDGAWSLLETPPLEPPTVLATVDAITRGISTTTVYDHRRAVLRYAERRSIDVSDDLVLMVSDGAVTVELDWQGRIAAVSGSTVG